MTSVVQYNDSLNEANETFSKKKMKLLHFLTMAELSFVWLTKLAQKVVFFEVHFLNKMCEH